MVPSSVWIDLSLDLYSLASIASILFKTVILKISYLKFTGNHETNKLSGNLFLKHHKIYKLNVVYHTCTKYVQYFALKPGESNLASPLIVTSWPDSCLTKILHSNILTFPTWILLRILAWCFIQNTWMIGYMIFWRYL